MSPFPVDFRMKNPAPHDMLCSSLCIFSRSTTRAAADSKSPAPLFTAFGNNDHTFRILEN